MPSAQDSSTIRAVSVLKASDHHASIQGVIHFSQMIGINQMKITGEIHGLPTDRKIAIHIHEYGDLSNGPISTGSRFQPGKTTTNSSKDATGYDTDFVYLQVNPEGHAKLDFIDRNSTLFGPFSVIGRSIVITDEKEDDLGRIETEDNKGATVIPTNRLAAGVIGICQ
jgi:Cu/Zn superoxide dismutase